VDPFYPATWTLFNLRLTSDTVDLDELSRMADFECWAAAGVSAFGWDVDDFLSAYKANRDTGGAILMESDSTAQAILIVLAENEGQWTGTMTELVDQFNTLLGGGEHPMFRYLPKLPSTLGGKVKMLAPALRAQGVEVEQFRDSQGSRKTRMTNKA
jgi:hypothetical protein